MNKAIIVIGIVLLECLFFIKPAFALEESKDMSGLEQIIYALYVKEYDTNETLIAYRGSEDIQTYIALNDFLGAVDFPIETSNLEAKGTFFNNNTLDIDLNLNKILVNNKEIIPSTNSIKIIDNQIYFSIALLESIFSVKISIDEANLILNIDSQKEFPIEVEANKNENRQNNLFSYADNKDENVTYKMESKLFSYPTIDFIATNRNAWNSYGKYIDNSYSFAMGAVIFGLDANIYSNTMYSNNPYSHNRNNTTIVNLSRYFPDNKANGSVKYFEVGDISSSSSVFLSTVTSGRGVMVTSLNNSNINQDKTVDIRDILVAGWEVELYYNDTLIGYRTRADSSGYYNFNNVPVYSGVNIFKLVFYGPFGEKRTEEKKILVDASPVSAGEFGYTISFFQEGQKVIEGNLDKEYVELYKTKDISSNINMYYGVFNNLTLNIGYAKLNDSNDNSTNYNFYNAGVIYSINSFAIENTISGRANYDKIAYRTSVSGSLDNLGYIYASYDNYNGIKSPASYMANMLIEDYIQLRYNNYINVKNFNLPITMGYKRYKYDGEQTPYEDMFYTRSSYVFYNNFDLTLEYSFDKYQVSRNILKGIVNGSFGKLLLRGYYERDITPKPQGSSFGASLNYNFNSYANGYMQADSYRGNTIGNIGNTYYQVGFSTLLPVGKISASYLTNIKREQEINISYGISLGYDETSRSIYYKSKTPLNESGNIVAKIFIDRNRNSKYDSNIDTPIEDARIKINDSDTGDKSDEEGNIYITSLGAYNSMNIGVNEESIDDIMLVPKVKQYHLILRPSTLQNLSFPFLESGYVEGYVNTKQDKCRVGVISVTEEDDDKNIIEKTTSDKDGLFLIEALPYGDYHMQIECNNKTYSKSIQINNYINYMQLDVG